MAISRREGVRGTTYEVRYRGPDGKERSRSFRSIRQARAYEAEQRSALARGGWVDPQRSSRPFQEVAAAWLRSNPGKRPSTLARDEVELRLHILPALGSRPVGGITPGDVERLVVEWSTSAEPRTVGRRYGVLRAVMNYAVSRDLIGRSPCRGIRLPEEQPLDRELPTAEDIAALAGAMGRYGPMAYLGVVLGLRWGEVAGLRLRRLDLDAGRVTIAEQVTRGPKGVSIVGPPKSRAGLSPMQMKNSAPAVPGSPRAMEMTPSVCLIPVACVVSWAIGGAGSGWPSSRFSPPWTTVILAGLWSLSDRTVR